MTRGKFVTFKDKASVIEFFKDEDYSSDKKIKELCKDDTHTVMMLEPMIDVLNDGRNIYRFNSHGANHCFDEVDLTASVKNFKGINSRSNKRFEDDELEFIYDEFGIDPIDDLIASEIDKLKILQLQLRISINDKHQLNIARQLIEEQENIPFFELDIDYPYEIPDLFEQIVEVVNNIRGILNIPPPNEGVDYNCTNCYQEDRDPLKIDDLNENIHFLSKIVKNMEKCFLDISQLIIESLIEDPQMFLENFKDLRWLEYGTCYILGIHMHDLNEKIAKAATGIDRAGEVADYFSDYNRRIQRAMYQKYDNIAGRIAEINVFTSPTLRSTKYAIATAMDTDIMREVGVVLDGDGNLIGEVYGNTIRLNRDQPQHVKKNIHKIVEEIAETNDEMFDFREDEDVDE